jgi:hypothetical protein
VVLGLRPGEGEDSGTDDRAQADGGELEQADAALEPGVLAVVLDRFAAKDSGQLQWPAQGVVQRHGLTFRHSSAHRAGCGERCQWVYSMSIQVKLVDNGPPRQDGGRRAPSPTSPRHGRPLRCIAWTGSARQDYGQYLQQMAGWIAQRTT